MGYGSAASACLLANSSVDRLEEERGGGGGKHTGPHHSWARLKSSTWNITASTDRSRANLAPKKEKRVREVCKNLISLWHRSQTAATLKSFEICHSTGLPLCFVSTGSLWSVIHISGCDGAWLGWAPTGGRAEQQVQSTGNSREREGAAEWRRGEGEEKRREGDAVL